MAEILWLAVFASRSIRTILEHQYNFKEHTPIMETTISHEVQLLVDAMNENNAHQKSTPYRGYEITETRRKYHLLNSILTNGQRSAVFMIDRKTLFVRKADGYGKAGRLVGTVANITDQYISATATHPGCYSLRY